MSIVERGSRAGDLLSHVALHEAKEFGGEVKEICDNGVDGDEIEVKLGVHVRGVMGGNGGGALDGADIVEVTKATELVVDLAHDADAV